MAKETQLNIKVPVTLKAKLKKLAGAQKFGPFVADTLKTAITDFIPTDDELDAFIERHNFDMSREEANCMVGDARSMHALRKEAK